MCKGINQINKPFKPLTPNLLIAIFCSNTSVNFKKNLKTARVFLLICVLNFLLNILYCSKTLVFSKIKDMHAKIINKGIQLK